MRTTIIRDTAIQNTQIQNTRIRTTATKLTTTTIMAMKLFFPVRKFFRQTSAASARGISLLELLVSLALASLISVIGVNSVRTVLRYRTVRTVATEIVRILDATALRAQALRADALVSFSADARTLRVTFSRSRLMSATSTDTTSIDTSSTDRVSIDMFSTDRAIEQSEFTLQSTSGVKIETRFAGVSGPTGPDRAQRALTLYATGTASPGTISIADEDSTTCLISQALRGARSLKCV